jgi:hypothetical protein
VTPTQNFDTTTGQSQPHQDKPTPQATATSMIKKLSITISCLLLMAGLSYGQTTQSINLFTMGSTTQTSISLSPGSVFSLDTYITFTGFTSVGLSYWLEAQTTGLAANLTLNNESYFQNWDANGSGTNNLFTSGTGVDAGYLRETRDLGSTSNFDSGNALDPLAPGTYKVSTLNFTLGAGIAPGTYLLRTTTLTPVPSEINDNAFGTHNVTSSFYTITVVPEPSTWSLVAIGAVGAVGFSILRRRQRA